MELLGNAGKLSHVMTPHVSAAIAVAAEVSGVLTGRAQKEQIQNLKEILNKSVQIQEKAFQELGMQQSAAGMLVNAQKEANNQLAVGIVEAIGPHPAVDVGLRLGVRGIPEFSKRRVSVGTSSESSASAEAQPGAAWDNSSEPGAQGGAQIWDRTVQAGRGNHRWDQLFKSVKVEPFVEVYAEFKIPLFQMGKASLLDYKLHQPEERKSDIPFHSRVRAREGRQVNFPERWDQVTILKG